MSEHELKVFTVEEANGLIPVLTELLEELQKRHAEAAELEVQIDAAELISGSDRDSAAQELEQLISKHGELAGEFYALVDEIHSHGCYLKDVDLGLIDFYGVVDGRVVYLCWRLGEEEVGYWHEVGEGYANRHPLESK